jgi:hypothetical protein
MLLSCESLQTVTSWHDRWKDFSYSGESFFKTPITSLQSSFHLHRLFHLWTPKHFLSCKVLKFWSVFLHSINVDSSSLKLIHLHDVSEDTLERNSWFLDYLFLKVVCLQKQMLWTDVAQKWTNLEGSVEQPTAQDSPIRHCLRGWAFKPTPAAICLLAHKCCCRCATSDCLHV